MGLACQLLAVREQQRCDKRIMDSVVKMYFAVVVYDAITIVLCLSPLQVAIEQYESDNK